MCLLIPAHSDRISCRVKVIFPKSVLTDQNRAGHRDGDEAGVTRETMFGLFHKLEQLLHLPLELGDIFLYGSELRLQSWNAVRGSGRHLKEWRLGRL